MSGMERWRGKVALITGASAGIGRELARRLAREGLRVVGWATRRGRLEALQEELSEQDFSWRAVNLRDLDQVAQGFDALFESHGGVDVMINNAGLGYDAALVDGDPEKWREILDVNVLALAVCTSRAVQDMRRRHDRGHVIQLSSMASHRVPLRSGMYSASKFAVRSMTEGLRAELRDLGSKIRVTAISPGFVETEFAARFLGDAYLARETYAKYPVIQPEDIAETVVHVLSAPDHVAYHDLLLRPAEQPT